MEITMVPSKTIQIQKLMLLIRQSTSLLHIFQIHSLLVKSSFHLNIFIITKLVRKSLSFPSSLSYAHSLFTQVPNPDSYLYNTLIRAYLHSDNPTASLLLFRTMTFLDSFSLSLTLQACGKAQQKTIGTAVHASVVKLGFGCDLFVQTALLEMYSEVGDIAVARKVFDSMSERDLVAFNVMLAGYVAQGQVGTARKIFDQMSKKDLVSWNTMVHGYTSIGEASAARELFDEMPEKDLVSWSTMISGYSQSRQCSKALSLFHEMQLAGFVPDKIILVSVITSCADVGALGMGKAMHKFIKRNDIDVDLMLGTSLVDMYAKCGDIDSSMRVFSRLCKKDVLTWSTMILGLANHGLGKVALEYFDDMIREEMRLDDMTFVGVLSACSHGGLVDEGRAHFQSMIGKYDISPKVEHYGCMVDLLGRAGCIEEARQVIEDMPFKPDAVIWRAVLGSCRMHRNVEIAEEAINNLIALEPYVDGHYVLLADIYARATRWKDVAKLRKEMRDKNIQRVPGSSSIEVENVVYKFVAGDKSNPRCEEIYKMLDEMIGWLKQMGYKRTVSLVLQDVDYQSNESVMGVIED